MLQASRIWQKDRLNNRQIKLTVMIDIFEEAVRYGLKRIRLKQYA